MLKKCKKVRKNPLKHLADTVLPGLGGKKRAEWEYKALKNVVHGVLATTGDEFFQSLAKELSLALKVEYVMIAKQPNNSISLLRTVSNFSNDKIVDNFDFDFRGTPCEGVIGKKICYYPKKTYELFPKDNWLSLEKIETYIGIPLYDSTKQSSGVIALMSKKPLLNPEMARAFLEVFGPRVSAELERVHIENELKESELRLSHLLSAVFDGVFIHTDKELLEANPVFFKMFGFKPEALIGKSWLSLFEDGSQKKIKHYLKLEKSGSIEVVGSKENGDKLYFEFVAKKINYHEQKGYITAIRDITEKKQSEAQMRHVATHDRLTNLANRMLFFERLTQAKLQAKREHKLFALHYIDLDKFKQINDTKGHIVGDHVLKAVAQRLENCVRETDTVARLGGDEFAIIQTNIEEKSGANMLAEKILEGFRKQVKVEKELVQVSLSIGFVLSNSTSDLHQLIKKADEAVYLAKNKGGGVYVTL